MDENKTYPWTCTTWLHHHLFLFSLWVLIANQHKNRNITILTKELRTTITTTTTAATTTVAVAATDLLLQLMTPNDTVLDALQSTLCANKSRQHASTRGDGGMQKLRGATSFAWSEETAQQWKFWTEIQFLFINHWFKPIAYNECEETKFCILFYFYSRLCPSTAGSSPPPESSSSLCLLLSLSISLPVASQCHLSNDVLAFQLVLHPAALCVW